MATAIEEEIKPKKGINKGGRYYVEHKLNAVSAFADKPPTFDLKFPEWYPTPREACHFGIIGPTGAGKSDLLQQLFTGGDLSPHSLHYVTKLTDTEPVKKIAKWMTEQVERLPPMLKNIYKRVGHNPNLRMRLYTPQQFNQVFDLDDVKLHLDMPPGLSKKKINQWTIIVIDDAEGIDTGKITNIAQTGRGKGITLVVSLQGKRKKEEIPLIAQSQLNGAWILGNLGRDEETTKKFLYEFGLNTTEAKHFIENGKHTWAQFVSKSKQPIYSIQNQL